MTLGCWLGHHLWELHLEPSRVRLRCAEPGCGTLSAGVETGLRGRSERFKRRLRLERERHDDLPPAQAQKATH
jgi:hypothetical protein